MVGLRFGWAWLEAMIRREVVERTTGGRRAKMSREERVEVVARNFSVGLNSAELSPDRSPTTRHSARFATRRPQVGGEPNQAITTTLRL